MSHVVYQVYMPVIPYASGESWRLPDLDPATSFHQPPIPHRPEIATALVAPPRYPSRHTAFVAMPSLRTLIYIMAITCPALSAALGTNAHAESRDNLGPHFQAQARNVIEQRTSLGDRYLKADGCQTISIQVPTEGLGGKDDLLVSPVNGQSERASDPCVMLPRL